MNARFQAALTARRLSSIVVAAVLLLGFAATAQTTNGLSPAEINGRQLAAEILSVTPATNFTQSGILRIRNSEGTTNLPITFDTRLAPDEWRVAYSALFGQAGPVVNLEIVHPYGRPNRYLFAKDNGTNSDGLESLSSLSQSQIMAPFAGSDFWIADLGLEFFHWPEQKITGHETRRMRDCTVLESDNPDPANGYSKVVTWVDNPTLGIIHAEAYDPNGKLLKVFDPKSLKKVNGQWELQDIEIRNVQTRSRTWIRFDLSDGKS
ncbi:MAG TPA: outer membrane lipoprotein-sorting protein [Verrucomicrobiae bacterium]|nr:outer membrane lipoprotein-sorting protein [Verrucomicrobiae bacterium]